MVHSCLNFSIRLNFCNFMNVETKPQRQYSASEQGFQRIMNEGPHAPKNGGEYKSGDFAKRVFFNTSMLVGGLGIDLAESAVAKWAINKVFDPRIDGLKGTISQLGHAKPEGFEDKISAAKDSIRTQHAIKEGVKFIEEWGSDSAYVGATNALARTLTGVPEATYVKGTAEVVSDWANAIMQVFGGDKKVTLLKYKGLPLFATEMQNFVNPTDVEAVFRLLAEIPGVGWVKNKLDHTVEHSKVVKYANIAASKGLLGYHITNAGQKAIDRAVAEALAK